MNNYQDPTIFESLNARQLTPTQVAQTFIPPDCFSSLTQRNNNVLIGPRGSGKTTLLKMLQLPALCSWSHDLAGRFSADLDYISAFIPSDIAWKEQWSLIDRLALSERERTLIKNALFTTHTLRALIEAFRYCGESELFHHSELGRFHVELSKETEAEIALSLSDLLKLSAKIPSLDYLELQLRARLLCIGELVNRTGISEACQLCDEHSFIYLGFFDSISCVIDVFNQYIGNRDQKWALLFDELEIAPPEIRRQLISTLRSTDQRLIFKLSISPYSEEFQLFSDPTSPSSGNDFVPITLWYSHKEDARPFCRALFDQMCLTIGMGQTRPIEVFGPSEFDIGNYRRRPNKSAYSKGSQLYQRFRRLHKNDESFQKYIQRRRIDLDRLDELEEDDRAGAVRKITNIVSVRDAFRKADGVLRTRKKPSLYTGSTSLFDITEGNPRLFIGIIGPLLKEFSQTHKTITSSKQSTAVAQASNRFRALLATIPVSLDAGAFGVCGMNDLLDKIGNYFFSKVVLDDFSADPPTSFIVDSETPRTIIDILGRAMNSGAIVYMQDDPGNPVLDSLEGRRFRLSYLLSPYYKIPLFASKSRALSKIIVGDEIDIRHDLFSPNEGQQ